jgi:hypothetical protein
MVGVGGSSPLGCTTLSKSLKIEKLYTPVVQLDFTRAKEKHYLLFCKLAVGVGIL